MDDRWRPPVRAVERIGDGAKADERVLDHLARLGCDPAEPREAAHYLYAPDRTRADAIAGSMDRDGWLTTIEEYEDTRCLVVGTRTRTLTAALVRETRCRLEALASEHGGLYDGWDVRTD